MMSTSDVLDRHLKGSVAKLSHGLGRRPDNLQGCENHGHLCSNGDTSNLR